jgi:hypothetical protein
MSYDFDPNSEYKKTDIESLTGLSANTVTESLKTAGLSTSRRVYSGAELLERFVPVRRMLEAVGLELIRFHSLPIPTSSVRNVEGKAKAMRVMPWLALQRLMGRADGTTLITMAQRSAKG